MLTSLTPPAPGRHALALLWQLSGLACIALAFFWPGSSAVCAIFLVAGLALVLSGCLWQRRALLRAENCASKLRQVLDRIPYPFILATLPEGRYIEMNPAAADFLGMSREQALGHTDRELGVVPEDQDHAAEFAELVRTGRVDGWVINTRRSDGKTFWGLYAARLLEFDGQPRALVVGADISHLKETEERLRRSEQSFVALFDSAPVPMSASTLRIDEAGQRTYLNSAWRQVFGYPLHDVPRQWSVDSGFWVVPEDRDRFIHGASRPDTVFVMEADLRCADGAIKRAALSGRLIESPDCPLLLVSYVDLSGQRALEAARRDAEIKLHEFREMVENANDAMVLVDGRTIVECNPAAERLYGLPRAAIVGQDAVELSTILLDDGSLSTEQGNAYFAAVESGVAQRFFWRHRRPDGSVFIAEAVLNPAKSVVLPGQGEHKRFVAVLRDVTATQHAAEALQASESRFRRLFELAPVPLLLSTRGWQLTGFNKRFLKEIGYLLEEVPDVNSFFAVAMPDPIYRNEVTESVVRDWEDLDIHGAEQLEFKEYRLRIKSGEERYFRVGGAPIGEDLMVSLVDVTELRTIQAQLKTLNANLELRVEERTQALSTALDNLRHTQGELVQAEKLAGLGALVAGVAHELNTPIGNAVMVASTLTHLHREFAVAVQEGLRRSMLERFIADGQEATEVIERNLQRAAELINSFKQVAVDQSSYQRRSFELSEVLHELQLTLSPTLRRSQVELIEEVGPGVRMDSYPGPLTQVLMNVVNNAVLHAFEGRNGGRVVVSGRADSGQRVVLTVSDNGCGIPAENLPRIFDPFFTTRLGRGGSGLGLHIVYSLVTELLGGTVRVESSPDAGTKVIIDIPLQAPQSLPPG